MTENLKGAYFFRFCIEGEEGKSYFFYFFYALSFDPSALRAGTGVPVLESTESTCPWRDKYNIKMNFV